MSYYEAGAEPYQGKAKDVLNNTYRASYVTVSELAPVVALQTYDYVDWQYQPMDMLCKMVAGLGEQPIWATRENAEGNHYLGEQPQWVARENVEDYRTEHLPGGLLAQGKIGGVPFTLEARALIWDGTSPADHRGGMAVRLIADAPKWFRCSSKGGFQYPSHIDLVNTESFTDCQITADPDALHLENANHRMNVLVRADQPTVFGADGVICCREKVWDLIVTFVPVGEPQLTLGAAEQLTVSQEHYRRMLDSCYIKTPEENVDYAFECARTLLAQAYFEPYGWAESIHHWPSMWHPEHTAAEEWFGNAGHSRAVMKYLLTHLLDGRVVDSLPSNLLRKHWGGNNPYMFRDVEHYLKMTADAEFAAFACPLLEGVLEQTFHEYDPTDSGLMGFGTQIANQEDFEGTPGFGSATAIEAAHMLDTMALVESLAGFPEKAEKYRALADRTRALVKKRFWMSEVGRYAWYEDAAGNCRLDPAYHSLCYPVVYNMMDEHDMVSSMDHLRHRFSGPDGEIFLTNHFGGHAPHNVATWGMQRGANNQFIPSMAFARTAMHEDAIRPLRYVADNVATHFRGSFPETDKEPFKAYFSPAACVWAQGMVEGIFGLNRDLLRNTTTITPCFPSAWDHAEIRLPGVHLQFRMKKGEMRCTGTVEDATQKTLCLRVAPCKGVTATQNGRPIAPAVTAHCAWFEIELPLGQGTGIDACVRYEELDFSLSQIGCVAVGDSVRVQARGAEILGLRDACGIFAETVCRGQEFAGAVKEELLDPYEKFGWFGLINFARRVFFLKLRVGGVEFETPVTLTLLPKFALHAACTAGTVRVEIHNNRRAVCPDRAELLIFGERVEAPVQNGAAEFVLPETVRAKLTPGTNEAELLMQPFCQKITFQVTDVTVPLTFVQLDPAAIKPPIYWAKIGKNTPADSTLYCVTPDNILCDVFEQYQELNPMPGLTFRLAGGFVPVNRSTSSNVLVDTTVWENTGHQEIAEECRSAEIDLRGQVARKAYVLLSAFITNQHAFSTPFVLEFEAEKEDSFCDRIVRVPLNFPGDLDIGLSGKGMYGFPSFVEEPHGKRNVLPALPKPGDPDYPEAFPPDYPQHLLWNMRPAFQVNETVFSIVEVSLPKAMPLKRLHLTVTDAMAAAGIYAVTLA